MIISQRSVFRTLSNIYDGAVFTKQLPSKNSVFLIPNFGRILNYPDNNTLDISGSDIDIAKQKLISSSGKVMLWFHEKFAVLNPEK